MIDKVIYKATINGIAAKLNNNNSNNEVPASTNLIILSLCIFFF